MKEACESIKGKFILNWIIILLLRGYLPVDYWPAITVRSGTFAHFHFVSGFFQCQLSCQCAFLLCAQLLLVPERQKTQRSAMENFSNVPHPSQPTSPPLPSRVGVQYAQIEFHIKFVSQQLENSKATRKKRTSCWPRAS